jgi:sulfur-oxidizing protein SoxY
VSRPTSRREFLLVAVAGGALGALVQLRPAQATPPSMQDAIGRVVGGRPVTPGRVRLEVPPLVENGNAVPLAISVESPMTPTEHVRAIHVFTEKNPLPDVASFHLGPRSGRAHVATRIRLVDTQTIVAISELSDGTFWSAKADVVVTLAACLEEA